VEIAPHYYQLKDVEDGTLSLSLSLSLCARACLDTSFLSEVGIRASPFSSSTLPILLRTFGRIPPPYILMLLGIKRIKSGCPMDADNVG
jgi:hypothetical protein